MKPSKRSVSRVDDSMMTNYTLSANQIKVIHRKSREQLKGFFQKRCASLTYFGAIVSPQVRRITSYTQKSENLYMYLCGSLGRATEDSENHHMLV